MTTNLIDPGKIWVIIPVYNEANAVDAVLKQVKKYGFEVVAINDCSTDSSLKVINSVSDLHVLNHMVNLGQGAALQTGISYALSKGAEYIVTFDADGQHPADSINKIVEPLVNSRADVTLGSRFLKDGGATNIPSLRKFLLKIAVLVTRFTTGLKVTDTHNGFRAFTNKAAAKLSITQNRMAHASQILAQIGEHNMKIEEVPVVVTYSEYSLGKGQRMKDFINIAWDYTIF